MTPKRTRAVALAVVLACAVATLGWLAFWKAPTMEVVVTVSTDDGEAREVYSTVTSLPRNTDEWSDVDSEIDMTPWAGRLVRLDIRASILAARLIPLRRGYVACTATLSAGGERRPLQFWGWENDGSEWLHFGELGCSDVVSVRTGNAASWLSLRGLLSHTLKVPPGASLRLLLIPMTDRDAEAPAANSPNPGEAAYPPQLESEESGRPLEPRPPDIFIYLIDAVRADHLGCYGYARPTSPHIDAFAETATVYENAQTVATWTQPSVATLLSGLYPFVHGAVHMKKDKLAEWPLLLPEILHESGYSTWGIITNPPITAKLGFDQGYDGYQYKYHGSPDWANERLNEYLAGTDADQPVFVYMHTMEPHAPYSPTETSFAKFDRGFDGRCDGSVDALVKAGRIRPKLSEVDIEHLIDRYDAEIFDSDRGFSEFLAVLEAAGRSDNALIIVLADHGEAFADHNTLEHGNTLNQEELHIPLIIRYPKNRFAGLRLRQRVSLIDIVPTVLQELGIEPDLAEFLPGSDIRPDAFEDHRDRRIFCEVSRYDSDRLDLVGVIDEDGYKLVVDMSKRLGARATKESIGLWDTANDVTETTHLESSHAVRASYCEQLIAQWLTEQSEFRARIAPGLSPRVHISEELDRELRGLGYVD